MYPVEGEKIDPQVPLQGSGHAMEHHLGFLPWLFTLGTCGFESSLHFGAGVGKFLLGNRF